MVSNKGSPKPVHGIVFQAIISLDVSFKTVFPYYIVHKVYLKGLFRMFFHVHVTHWLLCQTDEISTIFQLCIDYVYAATGEFYLFAIAGMGSTGILNRIGCIISRFKLIQKKNVYITKHIM